MSSKKAHTTSQTAGASTRRKSSATGRVAPAGAGSAKVNSTQRATVRKFAKSFYKRYGKLMSTLAHE